MSFISWHRIVLYGKGYGILVPGFFIHTHPHAMHTLLGMMADYDKGADDVPGELQGVDPETSSPGRSCRSVRAVTTPMRPTIDIVSLYP